MELNALKPSRRRANVIKALAHTSRLLIVDMLSGHERCADELTAVLGRDLLPASMHLRILESAGIITGERRGSSVYYSLRSPCILDFLRCVDRSAAGNKVVIATKPRIEEELCE